VTDNIEVNVKWFKEPPFNYPESELTTCSDPTNKDSTCYATVENYDNLADLEEKCQSAIDDISTNGTDHSKVHYWTGSKGADIFLCIFGTLWLFVAVAIICDDFFVPSLEAISEILDLSEDVAGATFMAAGSSAPELFTSLAAATNESDVGVGTIVGSAVFNLLVIVALSAALSGKVLHLDWRPLARDATFYTLSIAILIVFAWDGMIELYEAIILVVVYFMYVGTMFFNEKLMLKLVDIEEAFSKRCTTKVSDSTEEARESRRESHSRFINTSRATQQSIIGKKTSVLSIKAANSDGVVSDTKSESDDEKLNLTPCFPPEKWYSLTIGLDVPKKEKEGAVAVLMHIFDWTLFVLSVPFYVLYTLTIPPCDTPETRKWYLLSFLMAILWIVAISFGMLECVEHLGAILEINHFTMGLVIIAVGTSIPDAISSVLVAKEGFGDMAVSNAIGSNVFDINLGLGLPFLIFCLVRSEPVSLLKNWQWCVISSLDYPVKMMPHVKFGFVLFVILALTLMIFSATKFKLSSKTGSLLFLTYILFLAYSFTQEMACRSYDC
jgi:K+-dependent Na+/Ca+ exchanger-like protein